MKRLLLTRCGSTLASLRSLSSSSALKRNLKAEKKAKEKAEKQATLEATASAVRKTIIVTELLILWLVNIINQEIGSW